MSSFKCLKQRLSNGSLLVHTLFAEQDRIRHARAFFELPSIPVMMWEILVPANDKDGNEISVSYHQQWDDFVYSLSEGMTLLKTAKGTWIHPQTKTLIVEPMIPVRISCSREDIIKIAKFTKQYYNQHTVLAYQVSIDVLMI